MGEVLLWLFGLLFLWGWLSRRYARQQEKQTPTLTAQELVDLIHDDAAARIGCTREEFDELLRKEMTAHQARAGKKTDGSRTHGHLRVVK